VFNLLKSQTKTELIFLSYNAQNLAGKNFYHSLGFKRCGVKVNAIKWQNQYDDEVEVVLNLKTVGQSS
jgi:ribosomal protein S18 acetylase RimI-like enzyme